MRILIAEDEERIARFIERGLRDNGFTATTVGDGVAALDLATSGEFDLLVLDVGLPRMDGFTLLRTLRELGSSIPVIMVTARTAVEDTVRGLEGGADDYIAKPFRFEELLARIRLRLKGNGHTASETQDVLEHGDLRLDLRTRSVECGPSGARRRVELSSREFALARVFMENPNQVLTRQILLSRVWGYDFDGSSNVVDVYVGYLRSKLGADHFVTVRGAGYRLVDPSEAAGRG